MSGKTTDQDLGCLGVIERQQSLTERTWRAVTVSFAYALFALGALALACAVPWVKSAHNTQAVRTQKMRNIANRLARSWLVYCTRIDAVQVRMLNFEHLSKDAAGLLVANHPSLVDAIWIIATLPNVCCVLKGDLERSWLLRTVARNLGYVSNRDPEQLLAEGTRRLQAGELLLVFPEATRSAHGVLPQFRLGAAEMAIRSAATIHAITIHKHDPYLSKGVPWYAVPDRRMQWTIVYHGQHPSPAATNRRQARRMLTCELEAFFHSELSRPAVAHPGNQTEN